MSVNFGSRGRGCHVVKFAPYSIGATKSAVCFVLVEETFPRQ